MLIRFAVILVLATVLISCSEDDSRPSRKYQRAKLNIENAESLIAYKSGEIGRTASAVSNLYKLNTNGTIEPVTFTNEDGSDFYVDRQNIVSVSHILDVNDEFIILIGNFIAWDSVGGQIDTHNLLVNKTNGAIFSLDTHVSAYIVTDFGFKDPIQNDGAGNFYFSDGHQVVKVDLTDPENPKRLNYLPQGQQADYFQVDKLGNCVYSMTYNSQDPPRIRKTGGSIFEFPSDFLFYDYWAGQDGNLYYGFEYSTNHTMAIGKMNILANVVTFDTVWAAPEPNIFGSVAVHHTYAHKIEKENSTLFIPNNSRLMEFFYEENKVKEIELPEYPTEGGVPTDDYFYFLKGNSLHKFSLNDYSSSVVLPSGSFDLYKYSVGNDEVVQFSGLRFSDGKIIVAQIDAENNLTVIDEKADQEVLFLKRLN